MSTLPTPLPREAEPLSAEQLADVRGILLAGLGSHLAEPLIASLDATARALSLEKQRAARRDTSQEVPQHGKPVAVWWDKDEAPLIRRWDASTEQWAGGPPARRNAFVQWAPLP